MTWLSVTNTPGIVWPPARSGVALRRVERPLHICDRSGVVDVVAQRAVTSARPTDLTRTARVAEVSRPSAAEMDLREALVVQPARHRLELARRRIEHKLPHARRARAPAQLRGTQSRVPLLNQEPLRPIGQREAYRVPGTPRRGLSRYAASPSDRNVRLARLQPVEGHVADRVRGRDPIEWK